MVAEQVEQAQAGLVSLSLSQKTIHQLRQNFLSIEKLCQECQNLIENHERIKILSNARNNLNTTLKDIQGMMSISVKAAEARDSLSDDKELINTYERLTALDGKRRFALAAAASHKDEVGRLREYFEDVDRTWETFEKTLWSHIANFYKHSKERLILKTHAKASWKLLRKPSTKQSSVIFEDPGVQELLVKLYHKEWLEGQVVVYLVATFGDYFTDVKMYVEDRSCRRFVEASLEETVVIYVDHLLTQRNFINEETIERMRLDEEVLMDFFREYITVSKVENRVRILSDLRELASAESLDSFTLVYTNILEHHPDCPPEVVEKLVGLREGIPRKDAKEELAFWCRSFKSARRSTKTRSTAIHQKQVSYSQGSNPCQFPKVLCGGN